ncbi:MAG: hypothetical protein GX352_06115, partial [Clostridiales bacterium]|nr:hypothetical protein [Clostridiales bacterium]
MKSFERVEMALDGLKPDRVPTYAAYDDGYMMAIQGKDMRDFINCSGKELAEHMERAFVRHELDGMCVFAGHNGSWMNNHTVEKLKDYWIVTEKYTGEKYRLLPDGSKTKEDGTPIKRNLSNAGVSKIMTIADIDREVPTPPSDREIEDSGYLLPLKHLSEKYPQKHFSFQITTPFVRAMNACGGYEEGLMTMMLERNLFTGIVERYTEVEAALLDPGIKAGGKALWFTSYYTGADTISPKDYANLVFPWEKRICEMAKEKGIHVLYWFLGDLMPILDKVVELPIDALVLEQGRKQYEVDPVEIRKQVGEKLCIFGYGLEMDYCTFNKEGLEYEFRRQFGGAG